MSENKNIPRVCSEVIALGESEYVAKVVNAQGEVSVRVVHSLSALFNKSAQLNK